MIIESIGSGLESDIEDNTSEANPAAETSAVNGPHPNIDDNLPATVTLLRTPEGGKCYLLGTAHFSIESQKDVSMVIIMIIIDYIQFLITSFMMVQFICS